MIELGQILSGLVQRTAEGKLRWFRSVQDYRFIASLDTISVTITEEIPNSRYRLEIFDESGEIVESLGYRDTSTEQDEELVHLYVLARRSAHNIDETLEKLARALEL